MTTGSLVSPRLSELETVIERGLKTFVQVGEALAEIRETRIYKPLYGSFEAYCQERWGWNARRARQIIGATEVVETLERYNCTALPSNEGQSRPLVSLPESEQPAAWERAQELAAENSEPVRARHVEQAVRERRKQQSPDDIVLAFWHKQHILLTDAVNDTLENDGLTKRGRRAIWNDAVQHMIAALKQLGDS